MKEEMFHEKDGEINCIGDGKFHNNEDPNEKESQKDFNMEVCFFYDFIVKDKIIK